VTAVINPRRHNPRLAGEHVGKPRHLAQVQQIDYLDRDCLVHGQRPFTKEGPFRDGRALGTLDFLDLDAACRCPKEKLGDGERKPKDVSPVRKVCPVCRIRRSRTGTCFCD
jgi:rubredoxin